MNNYNSASTITKAFTSMIVLDLDSSFFLMIVYSILYHVEMLSIIFSYLLVLFQLVLN